MKPAFLLTALASGLLIGGMLITASAGVLPATVPATAAVR